MRFNERELAHVALGPGDKEGRLFYKGPGFREMFKERWFKLKGNLLFYFRLNEHGAVFESEPVGVIVVEQCRIQAEVYTELPNTFSLTFINDFEKRHYLSCQTSKQMDEWITCLKVCSYEYQRSLIKQLQTDLITKTGTDPLQALSTQMNLINLEDDADEYFKTIHVFSKNSSGFNSYQ